MNVVIDTECRCLFSVLTYNLLFLGNNKVLCSWMDRIGMIPHIMIKKVKASYKTSYFSTKEKWGNSRICNR
ncbi:hypothetical protein AN619_25340 [Thermotalea metallivorans]|uniref:Uncharacterized protein n=1 Tax=Thermotalea metallivorans TaxID=520762 RepID=A0A140L0Z1_9FIRM|nr:hypothetical protein AN619_25340 [Thermotalea metallivorans]